MLYALLLIISFFFEYHAAKLSSVGNELREANPISSHRPNFEFDPLIYSNSTARTHSLYAFFVENYGTKVISGQTTKYYDELVELLNNTHMPMIRAFDMQNYSPHNPWFNWQPVDDGTVQKAIDWYKETNGKGIVSFHWHWFSPLGGQLRTSTFYTNNTDFNLSKAVIENTAEYNATVRDINAIAIQLKRLHKENIPVLWRPLHEAGGGWFWWGSAKAAETLKLYNIIQHILVSEHQLNNLIWIWSTPERTWYPGNSKVDMIGFDSYPGTNVYTCNDFRFTQLIELGGQKKMVHMSENGPIPQFDRCIFKEKVYWGYFMSWSDLVIKQNTLEHIKEIYALEFVLKLVTRKQASKEASYKTKKISSSTTTTSSTTKTTIFETKEHNNNEEMNE